jgi:type I restriction enzyme S subunit
MMKKIKANHTQIRTLTALRDTLLPKLMSGEIRINQS